MNRIVSTASIEPIHWFDTTQMSFFRSYKTLFPKTTSYHKFPYRPEIRPQQSTKPHHVDPANRLAELTRAARRTAQRDAQASSSLGNQPQGYIKWHRHTATTGIRLETGRNEFMAMWQRNDYVTVDEIRVRVKDCRFDPLIHALRTCGQGVRPPLLIYMALSAPRNQCLDAIESWLRYCNTVNKHRRRAEYYFDVERSPWHRGDLFQFKRMLAARSKVWDLRLPDEAWFISRTMDDYVLAGAWSQSSWN